MPSYRVTITGAFDSFSFTLHGQEFRFLFSERGAWETPPSGEQGGLFLQPVSETREAQSSVEGVDLALRAFTDDYAASGLGHPRRLWIEVEEAGQSGATTRKRYSRP